MGSSSELRDADQVTQTLQKPVFMAGFLFQFMTLVIEGYGHGIQPLIGYLSHPTRPEKASTSHAVSLPAQTPTLCGQSSDNGSCARLSWLTFLSIRKSPLNSARGLDLISIFHFFIAYYTYFSLVILYPFGVDNMAVFQKVSVSIILFSTLELVGLNVIIYHITI